MPITEYMIFLTWATSVTTVMLIKNYRFRESKFVAEDRKMINMSVVVGTIYHQLGHANYEENVSSR